MATLVLYTLSYMLCFVSQWKNEQKKASCDAKVLSTKANTNPNLNLNAFTDNKANTNSTTSAKTGGGIKLSHSYTLSYMFGLTFVRRLLGKLFLLWGLKMMKGSGYPMKSLHDAPPPPPAG